MGSREVPLGSLDARERRARYDAPGVTVRELEHSDWPAVAAVYAEGIATGNATFETAVPSWEEWHDGHRTDARLVADAGGAVVGWAALSPVSRRCVYAGVAEVSIYVAAATRGQGVGRSLLSALISRSDEIGVWTLTAGIFPENRASLALHDACGFRVVGIHERIGRLGDAWRDVVLLERRSARL